jgi:hypothetical protein
LNFESINHFIIVWSFFINLWLLILLEKSFDCLISANSKLLITFENLWCLINLSSLVAFIFTW